MPSQHIQQERATDIPGIERLASVFSRSAQKEKHLVLRRNFGATVSTKSKDPGSQTQLLDDSLSKKLRFWFSDAAFSRQSQQKAEILVLRRSF